jgi:acarbose 7IV-phosphotransferase
VREQADRVVVVGPASWNTIVQVPNLPDPRPHTLFARESWSTLGGTSAGKALHLADLGLGVTLGTVIGSDTEGQLIRNALAHERIRLVAEGVEGVSERHLNLMAGGDRLSIYLSLPPEPVGPLPNETRTAIGQADHVVLDLSTRACEAIPLARSSKATVWTDLHDYDGESAFHRAFLDVADIVFMSSEVVADPRALMARMFAEGKRLVICTLGSQGACALDRDGWHHVDAESANVIDTNGAGDAFLAGFLSASLASNPDSGGVRGALRAGAAQAVRALGSRHLSPLLDEV